MPALSKTYLVLGHIQGFRLKKVAMIEELTVTLKTSEDFPPNFKTQGKISVFRASLKPKVPQIRAIICDLVVIFSNGQVVFLDHIVSTYPHFLEVLTPLDLSKLTSLMLDSLPRESCPHPLVRAKIRAIRACIKSPVFTSGVAEARALILPTFCSHLKVRQKLRIPKHNQLCCLKFPGF